MKKFEQRLVSFLLALIMVVGMLPQTTFATGAEEQVNPWHGKSAVFVGDSITAGSGTEKIYYQYLSEVLGFGSATAMGVAGSCISSASDYGQSNQPLISRYESIPSADLIVIFMGTNDYGHETPLGTAADTQEGSFYGALNTIIPSLVEKHASSKIVFVTPLHRYGFGTSKILGTQFTYDNIPNGVGATLEDYVNALKAVCAANSVSVIDLYTECTLDPTDSAVRASYMPDGLHPNAAGHEVIAGIMASHIREMTPAEGTEEQTELIYGNKFAAGFNQQNRASSRTNLYLKAGTVVALKDPEIFQWTCAKTSNESSNNNLGYFPDSAWTEKATAVVEADGWVGFAFKYRDESQTFDLSKPLSDYIHIYTPAVTVPTCTEQGYTTYTCTCGDSYVDNYTAATGHSHQNGACVNCGDTFAGKKVSILSHSMSTYAGVSNDASANSTIGSNDVYYTAGRHDVYRKDTWWQQTIDALGMELLVNNSWSGSCIFQPRKGEASVGYGDRAVNLHNDHTGEAPDVIFVYLGCNDFAYYKDTFGKAADVDYAAIVQANGDGTFTYAVPETACEAYAIMLHKVQTRYPHAEIYCMTSTARRDPDYADNYADTGQPTEYVAELHKVAEYFSYPVIDLENAIPKEAEIFDLYMGDKRAHANALGMDQITNEVLSVMLGREAEIRHVTSNGVVPEQAVLLGGTYNAEVTLQGGYSVAVTMAGEDITAETYQDGKVTIDEVTGDIVITANRQPMNFAWELNGDELVSTGEAENALSVLAGTVTDGVLNDGRYQLTIPVELAHDRPWVLEWKCTGDWRGAVLVSDPAQKTTGMRYITRTKGGQLCFGTWTGSQYDNYGVDLSGLDDQTHTYRLENRIASDGSNMVYLTVDGTELGAMNNYFVGSNSQNTTSDWVSGKDFVFAYMGMEGHPLKNLTLGYLQVFEGGETASEPERKTVSILGDSISTYTGVSNNSSYNSTISGNAVYYSAGTLGVYRGDTWWQQVIDALDMELLVNNSWSGSCVLNTRSGTVGAYADRCVQLHNSSTGKAPDVILVFLGTNDFSYYSDTWGTAADVDYETLIVESDGSFTYATPTTTCEAYAIMLHKMQQAYPNAEIYCMNLTARRSPDYTGDDKADVGQPTAVNAELAAVVQKFGCRIIDLKNCGIDAASDVFDIYMGDKRVHPNKLGMDLISEAVVSALLDKETDLYDVSFDLTNVTGDAAHAVLPGSGYSVTLTEAEGFENMTVIVTMGGEDVTASCYADGTVSIASVTGDVVITAVTTERDPLNFRWEIENGALVSVSTDGNTVNTPMLNSGSVTGGAFADARYTLHRKVLLHHDVPWVIEWKAIGDWSAMLLTTTAQSGTAGMNFLFRTYNESGLLAFGEYRNSQYHNYGIALAEFGLDMTKAHTYRLENRIASDGSNMVYLTVDGTELGAMNNYYIGGTNNQNKTVDWVSGKDFEFGYLGSTSHPLKNLTLEYLQVFEGGETTTEPEEKTISILGASMSTYTGISNNADTNSTIGDNAVYYTEGRHGVYADDTWWMQAVSDLDLRLLVNNSWSGSSLLYERNGTVGAYVNRCVQLHDDTGDNAGEMPDIIAIQMGTNDFQYYKDTLGTSDINYDTLITGNGDGSYTYATPTTSLEAAAIMMHKISVRYPDAEVYYLNISQRIDGTDDLIQTFNADLAAVCQHFGVTIVDIYNSGITMEDFDTFIGDGRVHPNCFGMDAYTEAFKKAYLGNHSEQTAYTVDFRLENVDADYGVDKAVLAGKGFACTLSTSEYYAPSVTVTMGGVDITASCYAGGKVTIGAVTGNVVITAKAVLDHTPSDYRWEFDGTDLASVSGGNGLTKNAGTTTDGVFSTTRYALETAVVLSHAAPWSVEWKCEGTFKNTSGSGARIFTTTDVNAEYNARYIFKSNNSGLIAMGEKTTSGSHNYGIALADHGIDWTQLHTYRLENRIADDGSNMVWLYVDGVEIGPMNNYYVGTADKNTTSEWLSGKDFIFPYMGTDTHGFNNCSIEYIQVWEGGHTHSYTAVVTAPTCTEQGYTTYTCICGDSYVDTYVDALTHDYLATVTYPTGVVKGYTDYTCSVCGDSYRTAWLDEAAYEGMTIACIGDSITYGVGATKDQTDYVKLLADQLGMDYIRLGASGTTLCTDGSRTCNIGKLTESNLSGADVVTIAMGINDFCAAGEGYYELGDINSTDSSTIYGAVRMWCERIVELRKTDSLSNNQFYFVTPLITSWNNSVTSAKDWDQSKVNIHGYTLRDLCNAIIEVAALYDVAVIDLNLISGLYYVDAEDNNVDVFGGDGVHPGDEGHAMMAAALANALLQNDLRNDHTHIFGSWITTTWPSCVAGEEQRGCSVCSATESSTLEANGCHRYAGVVTPPTNTQQGYTTYTCTICGDSYVGDYTEPIAPKSYRWEMQDNALVSVTTGSNTANALTLDSGSVTDGTLNSVRYSLQNKVRLYHDLPWVIEWRSSGNWDGMLFGSTMDSSVQGLTYLFRYVSMHFLAFGEYTGTWNNYGIIHDIDMTVSHVFRLENRIAADGSNAVYLLVDGQEIDVMHHYYVGGTNKNQTVNWANGKDIVFANIGTSSHPMKGMKLDYLQVWENGHVHTYESTVTAPTCTEQGYTTYTCTCGDSYVDTYVDALGHNYENGKCTICGAEHPELADYEGKVISIMGDSISTFAGYIPVADGFNREHLARYPQNNLLTDVNETWWMQVVSELDAKLGINDSWRGATLSGGPAVTTGDTGENAAMSNLTRIQNLGSNGTPDMILLYGGTNDLAHVSKVGTFDPATAPTQVDLTTKKWDNLADGFVHTLLRMRHYYPDAVIVAMLPTYTASYYSDEKLAQGNAVMAAICEHYGIAYVDLRDSGVTADHLPDGIHPGEEGMDLITAAVIETLLSDCTVELGEHVVYPVSHSLTNVNATLGHWKGVDANGTFVETLTGDNLTVQVTMGGVDVTDEVYSDGVISIAEVTGALSVSAKGAYSLDGHLQQLPEKAYNTTNLWDVLTHDEEYYSADGWVVHATGKVKSVTVPVTAGDKIAATSFGAAGDNGSSINGIRVTYFSEEGVLVSMSADQVYQEFSKNGYLTVPEGAVAVCVPMWAENGAEMYILTLPAIPTEENVHLSQKTQLQPDGSFTFTLEIYASEKVALYEDAVIRYVLNQGFAMTEKSTVRAVRMSEALKEAVLNENMAEAEDLTVTASEGVVDITGFDLSKEYISDEHSGSKLMITISYVEATDNVIWGENMDISTADSGIWADGVMAVAFTQSSAFFAENVYVMDYAQKLALDEEGVIHLDADSMGCFNDANTRLEMIYGTAVLENGDVVYIPGTMQWDGYDRFYAFASRNETYHWAKVAVIPANNVYYEDSFVATSAENAAAGAGIYYTNGTKPEDVPQDVWDGWYGQWESVSDNKTGNSVTDTSNVQGWINDLAAQTGFTGGSAHLVQAMLGQNGSSLPKATFTFTGTGVDIYSFTNNTTGTVLVQVSDVKGTYPNSYYIVDTGANTVAGYHQVPTISFVGKGYSTYQVTIIVTTAAASKNRFAFYLDGIRVYNPLAENAKDETVEDAYGDEMQAVFGSVRQMLLDAGSFAGETGEGTGFVFLDRMPEESASGNTNVIGTYGVYGPKNEVYLAKGQAIAFKVDENLYSRVQVGLKSLTGEAVQAVVSYFDEETAAAAQGLVSITHTADLYYELMPMDGYVVIRNTSDAILAVTKVKLMASGEPEQISLQVEKVSQAQVLAAVEEFDALPMMAYSLRSSRPDVEITVPETSVEDVAAAQLRALVEKLFGSVRKWLKEA